MIKLPIFDVSGAHGAPGISGEGYHSRATFNGRNGGHGTDGQHGTYASNISMRLATPLATTVPKNVVLANPIDANVKIDAYFFHTTEQMEKMDTILKINPGGSMQFHALGGNGGCGGNGGNGQDGGNGVRYGAFSRYSPSIKFISEYAWENRGTDATEHKNGIDGGPGGDGGNGGNAGAGGNGGSGGTIRISVRKADTHLLVLLGTINYAGGRGKSAGKPGIGGRSSPGYLTTSSI